MCGIYLYSDIKSILNNKQNHPQANYYNKPLNNKIKELRDIKDIKKKK
jgi:hypothetical protein